MVEAMLELHRVALVRYTYRDRSAPKLAALIPRIFE